MLFLLLFYLFSSNALAGSCSLGGSINFGIYSPVSSTPNSSSTSITVTCSLISIFNLALGTGQSGNFTQRYLTTSAPNNDHLNYNLYTNSSHSSIFGDGTSGTMAINQISINLGQTTVPVYGLMPALQNISAGTYQDFVPIIVSF